MRVRKPKPIVDPTRGQVQVVVSFRLDAGDLNDAPDVIGEHFRCLFGPALIRRAWSMNGLSVAVRQIGSQGEAGEDEGRFDRPIAGPSASLERPEGS